MAAGERHLRPEPDGDSLAPPAADSSSAAAHPWSRGLFLEASIVFLIALASRLVALEQAGMFDEYYHVLAAKQWLTDGSLGSATDGFYDRAAAFTLLVMLSIKAFGLSLVSARIPALLAGAAWAAVVYVGVRRIDGSRLAASLAGLFIILDPTLLGLSQVARFYTLHGLLFWVGIFALHSATHVGSARRRRVFAAGLAVAAFAGALHLQVVTVIGFGAVMAGLLIADSRWMLRRLSIRRSDLAIWLALGLVAVVGIATAWVMRSTLTGWWARFGWAPPWLADQGHDVRYYHWWLQAGYPLLWGLLPIAGLGAVVRRPRFGTVCFVAFTLVFVTSSLAASQLPRYFAYAMPFLFIVWGLALAEAGPWIVRGARAASQRVFGTPRWGVPLIAIVVLFAMANTPSWVRTARALNPANPVPPYSTTDWASYETALKAELDEGSIVVTTAGPPALYHLHRLDFEVGTNFLPGGQSGSEFSVDSRLGRPVLSTTASLSFVVACHPRGLLVAPEPHWRRSWGVSDDLADWIEAELEPIAVASASGLRAFRWAGSEPDERACEARLPR